MDNGVFRFHRPAFDGILIVRAGRSRHDARDRQDASTVTEQIMLGNTRQAGASISIVGDRLAIDRVAECEGTRRGAHRRETTGNRPLTCPIIDRETVTRSGASLVLIFGGWIAVARSRSDHQAGTRGSHLEAVPSRDSR